MHYGTCENEKTDGDAEAAAGDPPSPRLRRIKGGDEAAGEEGPVEGQRIFPAAKRRFVREKGREMKKWNGVRRLFCDIAIALLVVGYSSCLIHGFVSCSVSGALGTGQGAICILVAFPAIFFRCWGILSAAVILLFIIPMVCH